MSNVAVNDAGDVVIFDGQAWQPAPVAQNGRGERVYFDGQAWQPLQMRAPEPVVDAARVAGGAVANVAQGVANVPGSWWSRRARDLIEGPAAALDAIADAMNPSRGVPRMLMAADQRARVMPGALDFARGGADAAGLATPQTPGERMTSAVVQGAAGAIPTLGAGFVARAPAVIGGVTGTLSQLIGGGAGAAAAEGAAQGGYGPVTQAVAGLAGGLGAAGATQAAGAAFRGAGAAAQPLTAGGRERLVAEALLQSSTDPTTLAQRIDGGLNAPGARLPDSPVTTAVAARDPAMLAVESSVRDGALGPQTAVPLRDAAFARNEAQRAALAGMADGRTAAERGLSVRTALAGAGTEAADDIGAQQALAAGVRQRYDAVDPQGNMRIATRPLLEAAQGQIRTLFNPATGGEAPPPALQSIIDDIANAGEAVSWQFAQNIRSRLGEVAGKAQRDGDGRLASAAGGVIQAIDQNAMTPQWQAANQARREMGALLERDASGANATGTILRTDNFRRPITQDETVPQVAIRSPAAVRQVMEAQYRALEEGRRVRLPPEQMEVLRNRMVEARSALRGQFIENLTREVTTNTTRLNASGQAGRPLSAAWFQEFWDQNRPVAAMLFDRPQMRQLELIARDFAEASIGANAGRSAGSQTAQNLSVGALIARASNGLLDPSNPLVSNFMRPIAFLYRDPEIAAREVFGRAMADPRFAAMLLARASPNAVRRATAYVEQNMGARLREAAITGGTRQAIRTGAEEERRQTP